MKGIDFMSYIFFYIYNFPLLRVKNKKTRFKAQFTSESNSVRPAKLINVESYLIWVIVLGVSSLIL